MKYGQFIDGVFRDGSADSTLTVIDPSNGESLGTYAAASAADIRTAVDAAAAAFAGWAGRSAFDRSGLLRRAADLIRERKSDIGRHISCELGKTAAEALREVEVAAEMFEWAAEEGRRLYGRIIPSRAADVRQSVYLEPIGPVAAFSGWNAPAVTPSRKISGALAAGCTIVLKPSEETPGPALLVAQALHDAGVPPGVVNLVFGDPAAIADQLCDAPEIAMITFTGGTAVGKRIGARAALSMKRATLELGGHAPVVVGADVDVERVAAAAVDMKYRNAGQVCISPTRFIVQASVYDAFSAAFVRKAKAIRVGDPFDPATRMGPLKNRRRLDAIERLVQDARDRGGVVATGGRRLEGAGLFYEPTVLLGAGPHCAAANEEPFGPIALIDAFERLDDAIAEANRLPFGLAAYGFTNDLGIAQRLATEIRSGVVCINEWLTSLPETPFGGVRDSGLGSEGGVEGLHEFLRVKTVRQRAAS